MINHPMLMPRALAIALLAQADALEWALEQMTGALPAIEHRIGMREAELRAQAAALEAQESEPVAWMGTGAITHEPFFALRDEPRSDACAPWIPLYTHPDPRVAELEWLLGEALDTCHLGDDAGLHKRILAVLKGGE